MITEILIAIDENPWELKMGRAISDSNLLKIARRCVDLAEVLTMLEVGRYQAVILSSELPGLDLEVIEKIKNKGTLAIGVFDESDIDKVDFLSELGLSAVLGFFSDNSESFINNLIFYLNKDANEENIQQREESVPGLIAVWGTEGAPGRSSFAIDLAFYLNQKFKRCLLIDADAQAPAIGASLGITEEISGLSAAIHLAQKGKLTKESLEECIDLSRDKVPVLTGIARPSRWMELRGSGLEKVLKFTSKNFIFQVIDTNATFPDEKDSKYPEFDSTVRFGHLLPIFKLAEQIIFVVKATPLGIIRAAELLGNQNNLAIEKFSVVVNQLDELNFNKEAAKLIYDVLQRFIPKNKIWFHKNHPQAYAEAWLKGTSGYSLIKSDRDLVDFFDQFSSTRALNFEEKGTRKSKFVA